MENHSWDQIPNMPIYAYLEQTARQHADKTAITFYGKKITFAEVFENIDRTAKALIAYGIGKDDVVAASLPGIPEGMYLIYAINKIGAVYCAFDCRSKNEEIKQTMQTFRPKLCIVPDFQVAECHDITDCPIVHINPIYTLGAAEKVYSLVANTFTGRYRVIARNPQLTAYAAFIEKGSSVEEIPQAAASNDLFGYFYTSGTTFGRKSVMLTNRNVNAAAVIQRDSHPGIIPGEVLLNIMPLFTCYSVTLAMHLPFICGVGIQLIPLLDPKKMKKVLLQTKPNYMITVPAHWEYFSRENFKGCDLSFLKLIIVGGDTMKPEFREKLNGIFAATGAGDPLHVGYGLTETASTAVAAIGDPPVTSVGRALPFMELAICDPDTNRVLPAGEEGEICICGPTVCKGYFGDQEATDRLLKTHEDGRLWLHSGDRGYLDENGALYFCERYKRMYVRFDGTKVSPYSIEQGIAGCPIVANVLVVAITDTDHTHGKCPKAYIVLKEGVEEKGAEDTIRKYCKKNLDQHMQPKEIVITDKLPHTKNGKLRYFE